MVAVFVWGLIVGLFLGWNFHSTYLKFSLGKGGFLQNIKNVGQNWRRGNR